MGDIKAIDLFCGAGGATTGMVDAGINVVAGVDSNEDALKVYKDNHDHKVIQHDLSNLNKDILPTQDIDWIHGSPPCKGFSRIGKQKVSDNRNKLVFNFTEWVNEIEPDYVTMENVPQMRNMVTETGDDVKKLIESELDNYNINWKVLNAKNYGVPQDRKRLFLFGSKDGCSKDGCSKDGYMNPPEPTHSNKNDEQKPLIGLNTIVDDEYNYQFSKASLHHHIAGRNPARDISEPSYTANGTDPNYVSKKWDPPYDSVPESPLERLSIESQSRVQSFDKNYFDTLDSSVKQFQFCNNSIPPKLQYHISKKISSE